MKELIQYEDNHLLIVIKPPNMPVQEDISRDLDLLTALKNYLKVRDNKPGNVYLGLVHRLDRPVGGLMVFAKTSKAASRLSDQIRRQVLRRKYLAVVYGDFPSSKQEGQMTDYLWKDKDKNQVYVVKDSHPQGKKAILNYQVLDYGDSMSLVQVELLTGRSHQIRVQFKNAGHPLYGDQKYGGQQVIAQTQIALWSHEIQLSHPTLKETMTFQALPPENYPWNNYRFE